MVYKIDRLTPPQSALNIHPTLQPTPNNNRTLSRLNPFSHHDFVCGQTKQLDQRERMCPELGEDIGPCLAHVLAVSAKLETFAGTLKVARPAVRDRIAL